MKLFISVDMEGISGVTCPADVVNGTGDYQYFRELMTQDVNAAIEGALEAGATEIVVNDSHYTMRNLILDKLHPKAEVIRGLVKPLLMMEGIDESFDAAFFIGYHCMAGKGDAILNHTISTRHIQRLMLNGREIGEAGLNAAIAGAFGVPVVLVTGDSQTSEEVKREINGVHTVAVKKGISNYTAQCIHPHVAQQMIKAEARVALENRKRVQPIQPLASYTIDIEFKLTYSAQVASFMPGIELLDGKTVRYQAKDIKQAIPALQAMLFLGEAQVT